MSLVNQGGKLLLTNGVLASGAECCCVSQCSCGQCNIVIKVNGIAIPVYSTDPVDLCELTCERVFGYGDFAAMPPIVYCEGTSEDQGECDVEGGFGAGFPVCTSVASACLTECTPEGFSIRVLYGDSVGGQCIGGCTAQTPCGSGLSFPGYVRYADYSIDALPACESEVEATLIQEVSANDECGGARDAACNGCAAPVVTVACNPFP